MRWKKQGRRGGRGGKRRHGKGRQEKAMKKEEGQEMMR